MFGTPRPLPSLCLFALTVLGVTTVGRAALRRLELPELIRLSPTIVHARVTSSESFQGFFPGLGDEVLVTEVVLEPIGFLRGEEHSSLRVRIPGGKVGDLEMVVSGAPVMPVGEEVVVFLQSSREGYELIPAHMHGKYRVRRSEEEVRVVGQPGAPIPRSVPLSELARQVVEIAAEIAREGGK